MDVELAYLTPVKQELKASLEKRFSGVVKLLRGLLPTEDGNFGHSVYRVAAMLDPCYTGWMDLYLNLEPETLSDLKKSIIGEH